MSYLEPLTDAEIWLRDYVIGESDKNISQELLNVLQEAYPVNDNFKEKLIDGCLYRAYYFPTEDLAIHFIQQIKQQDFVEETQISSWTDDIWCAYSYFHGASYNFYNENVENGYGVILSCDDFVKEDILISYLNLPKDFPDDALENMESDDEFILRARAYKVKIRKLSYNLKDIISDDILSKQTDIFAL